MIEQIPETSHVNAAAPPTDGAEVVALEQRVRRLEDAVAVLQDTQQLEERIVERLGQQRAETAVRHSAGLLLDAGKRLLPVAAGVLQSETRTAEIQARAAGGWRSRPWLLFDVLAEVRAMVRMFVDPRYSMTWPGRLALPVLGGLLFLSWWQLGSIPFVGALLDKLADVLFSCVAYKVLAREVARYRELIPDAPLPPPRT
jgi:hypothetical protein